MKVLLLYNASQSYTNTVFEHLNSFARYSRHEFFFCHCDARQQLDMELSRFDAVLMHYSVRLPYDQISNSITTQLRSYAGTKVLFVQDEYDHTHRVWEWIKCLGFATVFTVVPSSSVALVYPPEFFPGVRFINNLTGYVPEQLPSAVRLALPSQRNIVVGYRGRPLPLRYGQLGFDKSNIARMVETYCNARAIKHDIASTDEARIHGAHWYEFIGSCRSMLGTESGANAFDWDGSLEARIAATRKMNPWADDQEIYREVISPIEMHGLMNQVSPRIFEAVAMRTALVLFPGNYSGVVRENEHFIPLARDGSNLDEVFEKVADDHYIDEMTQRAYDDVICSGRFSYRTFVRRFDEELIRSQSIFGLSSRRDTPLIAVPQRVQTRNQAASIRRSLPSEIVTSITPLPWRASPPTLGKSIFHAAWRKLPVAWRKYLEPTLLRLTRGV